MTETTPKISVVIPALNAAETLGEQLEALADQQYFHDWEVIVVDNGSVDGTNAVAQNTRRHGRCTVRVVIEPHRGLNRARNAGVRAAFADHVAICDADDVVESLWLCNLEDGLEEADLVGGGMAFSKLNDGPTLELRGWQGLCEPVRSVGREFGFLDQLICGNVAFRTAVWRSIGGFDEHFLHGGDDVDFSWRAQLAGFTVAERPQAVLNYRGRTSRMSLFKQYVRDGMGGAHLYAVHNINGMPRRSPAQATRAIVSTLLQLLTLPFRDRSTQGHLIRAAGKQWGRLRGSVKYKVVFL